MVDDAVQNMTKSLALISTLTKICNSPMLLRKQDDIPFAAAPTESRAVPANVKAALALLPQGASFEDVSLSGKLTVLSRILHDLKAVC